MMTIVKIDKHQAISRIQCELPDEITGIGYSQKEKAVVFYRAIDGLFGFVDDGGNVRTAIRRLEVNHPSGMCCDSQGICVLQFSNNMFWGFDQSYQSGHRLFGAGVFKTLSNIIPKDAGSFAPYGICRSANRIVIATPWGHRLLTFSNHKIDEQIGSGKRGFASSQSPRASMFNSPSGVCFDDGSGLLFVSDTGNSVVRILSGTEEKAFIGTPNLKGSSDGIGTAARLSSPSIIRSSRGSVAFIDDNLIRTFNVNMLDVKTPYASSRKIIDLAMGGDALYVLEDDK